MSEPQQTNFKEIMDVETSFQDTSIAYEEYGELEISNVPTFEFSSPISTISNCSSPDRDTIRNSNLHHDEMDLFDDEDDDDDDDDDMNDFVSLEELNSQISPPSDDEKSTITLNRKSLLETIFEDVYLETPPGSPSAQNSSAQKHRTRRTFRTDLSKCDEFKENIQDNNSS
jgi:hypothetical protein